MGIWIEEMFGVTKPIIGMCHLLALPGDPQFDRDRGMEAVINDARFNLDALQTGGVDAIMFSNEFSFPYLTKVNTVTVAAMARVIAELKNQIKIPFGVNVLWDPIASLDLAAVTGASFVREIFTGVYASDFGLWNTNCGQVIRHQHSIGAQDVRLFFNILPEAAAYISNRDLASIARSTVFNTKPDAICISGLIAGEETSLDSLRIVKEAIPNTPIVVNTGVNSNNVSDQLAVADAAIVGTTFKKNGVFENSVDVDRVSALMSIVHNARSMP